MISFFIPLAVLAPNLMFFVGRGAVTQKRRGIFEIIEYIGRIGVFLLPISYEIKIGDTPEIVSAAIMVLCLAVYYFCWLRYLRNDKSEIYLYKPLWIIPLPMAIFPVIYLAFSSVILNSVIMLFFTGIFAVGHLPVTWIAYKNIKKRQA